MDKRIKDVTGMRFGRLIVLSFNAEASGPGKGTFFLCRCDCGTVRLFKSYRLINGTTKSCGCFARSQSSIRARTHGLSKTKLYRTWQQIHQRCYNVNYHPYKNYGGRGICVDERWHSFENFFEDNKKFKDSNLSIDRIDNDLDYSPDNCRWVDVKTQQRNRRINVLLYFGGKSQTMSAWAEELGMSTNCLWSRLKSGWSVERALTTPKRSKKPRTHEPKGNGCDVECDHHSPN